MKILVGYGTAAKRLLPELHKLVDEVPADTNLPDRAQASKAQAALDGIKATEATTDQLSSSDSLKGRSSCTNRGTVSVACLLASS